MDANLTYISSVCFNKKNVLMYYCIVKKKSFSNETSGRDVSKIKKW